MAHKPLDFEQSLQYIKSMDFTYIVDKLIHNFGWSKAHALEAEEAYRRFLILHKKYGHKHQMVPSIEIDEFWHLHILHTINYRTDCDLIFGSYCDHDPSLASNAVGNGFAKTIELYAYEFHEELYEIRGRWAKIVSFMRRFMRKSKRIELPN